jgi:hypothetical protein
MNFGWHWSRLDVLATFGFFAPVGSYDADKFINNGLGRWAEMFGLGAVAYLDAARSWSVSAMTRYLTHQKQKGAEIRVGDDFVLEWGLGKTFRPSSWEMPCDPRRRSGVPVPGVGGAGAALHLSRARPEPQQQEFDKGQCYSWPVQQTGFDPVNPQVATGPPPTPGSPQGGLSTMDPRRCSAC